MPCMFSFCSEFVPGQVRRAERVTGERAMKDGLLYDHNSLMPSSSRPRIRFGPFEVDPQSGELHRLGSKVNLQGQPYQVLALLLERPGEMVTRDELCTRLWPADTFVDFERGLNKAINKLRAALRDNADKPRFIETLPQRGYRFIAPVESLPETQPRHTPQIDSLAVLSLENLTGDPSQEFFSDGLTEELICALANISSLRVISRTSAAAFKGSRKSLPQIAKELGRGSGGGRHRCAVWPVSPGHSATDPCHR